MEIIKESFLITVFSTIVG